MEEYAAKRQETHSGETEAYLIRMEIPHYELSIFFAKLKCEQGLLTKIGKHSANCWPDKHSRNSSFATAKMKPSLEGLLEHPYTCGCHKNQRPVRN